MSLFYTNYPSSKNNTITKPTLLCLWFIWLGTVPSFGQILNVEKAKIPRDSSQYFVINGALNGRIFNRSAADDAPVRFFGLSANADMGYFSKKHSYQWINFLDYLVINENPITSFGYSHFRANFLRNRRITGELFAQAQYDLWRGLRWRTLAGGGLRLKIINQEKTSLILGTGLLYENELWEVPSSEEDLIRVNALKSSSYLTFRADLKEYLSFNAINYYQIGRDDVFKQMRQRWSIDANLNVQFTTQLSFKVSFSAAYENRPIVPITKFIYSLSNGIQYRFTK